MAVNPPPPSYSWGGGGFTQTIIYHKKKEKNLEQLIMSYIDWKTCKLSKPILNLTQKCCTVCKKKKKKNPKFFLNPKEVIFQMWENENYADIQPFWISYISMDTQTEIYCAYRIFFFFFLRTKFFFVFSFSAVDIMYITWLRLYIVINHFK